MKSHRTLLPLLGLLGVMALVPAHAASKTTQAITFGTAPTLVVGGTGTVSATADSNQIVTFSSATKSICTVSGSTVTGVSVGTCTINANQAGNATYAAAPQVTQNITVGQGSQTITFGTAPAVVVGSTGTVSATASSKLAVTFTAAPSSVCTISNGKVTGVTIGTCTITANQSGNTNYTAAPQVTLPISVTGKAQTIKLGTAPKVVVGGTGTLTATASSGLAVTLTPTTSTCTVSGTTVTGVAVGTCTINATQAGNDTTYAAATPGTTSITIGKGNQTITFGSAPAIAINGTGTIVATGGNSGNPVTFSSATKSICTVSGSTVTGVTAGTCTIAADQTGNTNYNAATEATLKFSIAKISQTITLTAPTVVVGATATVNATAASTLPVVLSTTTKSICTVSGSTVTGVAVGTCTINANQAGNATYAAAPQMTQNITVGQGSQTITFGTAPTVVVGSTGTVSATASSKLAVTLTAAPSSVCTISNGKVTGVTIGTCTVTANQPGNTNYTAAPQVTLPISVTGKTQTIKLGDAPKIVVGGTGTLTATASSALAVTLTATTSTCTVSGTTVTGVAVGTCTINATQAGNTTYAAAASTTKSFPISLASQTITFGNAPTVVVGGTGMISATASSGLTVTLAATTSTCTLTGNTVTGVSAGTCTITANQSGNSGYSAAAQVAKSFTIGKGGQTITFGAAPTVAVGSTGTVVATASSGLPVTLSSNTKTICTVSGTQVTGVSVGTCTIAANQTGNSNYSAAAQATQSITVSNNTQVTVTPSLGAFTSGGGTVTIMDVFGNTIASTTGCCTNGSATVAVPTSAVGSPIIVVVQGGTYYDEATQGNFTQTLPMIAVVPAVTASASIAVNPLTNAAAAALGVTPTALAAGGQGTAYFTPTAALQANAAVADLLGFQGVNIVSVIPTSIGSSASQITGSTTSDQLAVMLAALSLAAQTNSMTPDAVSGLLASSVSFTPGTNPVAMLSANGSNAINTALNSLNTALPSLMGPSSNALSLVMGSPPALTLSSAQQTTIGSLQAGATPSAVMLAENFFSALRTGILPYVVSAADTSASSNSGTPPVSTMSITVTPSLGQFSSGLVTLMDASGDFIASSWCCNAGGAVTFTVPNVYIGLPLIVEVSQGNYYDEGTQQSQWQYTPMLAVVPAASASLNIAVNPLTNAAAAAIGVKATASNDYYYYNSGSSSMPTVSSLPNGTSAAAITQANVAVADLMGLPSGTNVLTTIPTPIGSSTDTITGSTPSDEVALVLAALSNIAASNSVMPDTLANTDLASAIVVNTGATPTGTLGAAGGVLTATTVNTALQSVLNSSLVVVNATDMAALSAVATESALSSSQKTAIAALNSNTSQTSTTAAATGFLNQQAPELHTETQYVSTAVDYLGKVVKIAKYAYELRAGQMPDSCQQLTTQLNGSTNNATCLIDINGQTYAVVLNYSSSNAQTTWQIEYVDLYASGTGTSNMNILYPIQTCSATGTGTSGYTCSVTAASEGTIDFTKSGSTLTLSMNGWIIDPMTWQMVGQRLKVGRGTMVGSGASETVKSSTNAKTGATCTSDDAPFVVTMPSTMSSTTNTATTLTVTMQGTLKLVLPDNVTGLTTCSGSSPTAKLVFGTETCTTAGVCTIANPSTFTGTEDSAGLTFQSASLGPIAANTANYVFSANTLTVNQVTSILVSNQHHVNGAAVSFNGTVSGMGTLHYRAQDNTEVSLDTDPTNNFTILSGKLTASLTSPSSDGSKGYNPTLPASATNSQTGTLAFTGQVFRSATDAGLKLVIGENHTWNTSANGYQNALSLSYYDLNKNLTVTGTTTFGDHPSQSDVTLDLSAGNGVAIDWTRGVAVTPVLVGTSRVGAIDGNRVSFTDGTFQSLY